MSAATHVQHAVQHSFDLFTQTMDRLVLEGYLEESDVAVELFQQGLIDFADMWENYVAQDCE